MLLAAMLAMALAAAAPAFGQAVATTGDAGENQYEQGQQNDQQSIVQDSICVNVQQAAANQYEGGDQAAAAETGDVIGDTNAAASASNIANALGISAEQVNQCLNQVNSAAPVAASPAPGTAAPGTAAPGAPGGTAAPAPGGGGGTAAAGAATAAAGGALPPTGGAPLLALGAGALLVASGLLARRIVR